MERKWDTHTYILTLEYSVIKKEILHLCDNMDEPAGCSAAWNKSDGERQLSYDLEKKSQTQRNREWNDGFQELGVGTQADVG